jgi:hypothetical protein
VVEGAVRPGLGTEIRVSAIRDLVAPAGAAAGRVAQVREHVISREMKCSSSSLRDQEILQTNDRAERPLRPSGKHGIAAARIRYGEQLSETFLSATG